MVMSMCMPVCGSMRVIVHHLASFSRVMAAQHTGSAPKTPLSRLLFPTLLRSGRPELRHHNTGAASYVRIQAEHARDFPLPTLMKSFT
jgi:hypothetical protein